MENDEYRDFVLDIYQAVSHPSHWLKVLDRITERVNAQGCIVFEWSMENQNRRLEAPLFTSNHERADIEKYLNKFQKLEMQDHDQFDKRLLNSDTIDVVSEEILYDDEANYFSLPHVKFLTSLGLRYRTGALLDKDNPFRARFSLSMSEERGPFDEADLHLLDNLLPHVAKAMELGRPVAAASQDRKKLMDVLNRLTIGVCVVDANGAVEVKNTEFDRQAEEYGAFSLDRANRLRLHKQANHQHFSRLLQDALNHGQFGARPRKEAILVETEEAAGTLCIEVTPMKNLDEIGNRPLNGALIISRDTTQEMTIDMEFARQAFDLTSAESAVVDMVCQGLTNSEIASRRERSVDTVNAQMKSILSKTRSVNRTQLVRVLCNFSASSAFAPA